MLTVDALQLTVDSKHHILIIILLLNLSYEKDNYGCNENFGVAFARAAVTIFHVFKPLRADNRDRAFQ